MHLLTLFAMLPRYSPIEMWLHAWLEVTVSTLWANVINRFCVSPGASPCKLMTAAQGNELGLQTRRGISLSVTRPSSITRGIYHCHIREPWRQEDTYCLWKVSDFMADCLSLLSSTAPFPPKTPFIQIWQNNYYYHLALNGSIMAAVTWVGNY